MHAQKRSAEIVDRHKRSHKQGHQQGPENRPAQPPEAAQRRLEEIQEDARGEEFKSPVRKVIHECPGVREDRTADLRIREREADDHGKAEEQAEDDQPFYGGPAQPKARQEEQDGWGGEIELLLDAQAPHCAGIVDRLPRWEGMQ